MDLKSPRGGDKRSDHISSFQVAIFNNRQLRQCEQKLAGTRSLRQCHISGHSALRSLGQ